VIADDETGVHRLDDPRRREPRGQLPGQTDGSWRPACNGKPGVGKRPFACRPRAGTMPVIAGMMSAAWPGGRNSLRKIQLNGKKIKELRGQRDRAATQKEFAHEIRVSERRLRAIENEKSLNRAARLPVGMKFQQFSLVVLNYIPKNRLDSASL